MATKTRLFYTFLSINIFFIILHSGMIYYGTRQEAEIKTGLITAFSVGLAYALVFLGVWVSLWTFDNPLGRNSKYFVPIMYCLAIAALLYVASLVAIIIAGCFYDGNLRVGLIVGGSVALVHFVGFIMLFFCLCGLSAAKG